MSSIKLETHCHTAETSPCGVLSARELVALLEARCKALGAEEFTILTGRDNAPAQALYRALGYAECDEVMFAKTTGA